MKTEMRLTTSEGDDLIISEGTSPSLVQLQVGDGEYCFVINVSIAELKLALRKLGVK